MNLFFMITGHMVSTRFKLVLDVYFIISLSWTAWKVMWA